MSHATKTEVKLRLFQGGYCTHKEKMVYRTGARNAVRFPSLFALISHPKHGHMLYDTGYSTRFFEATRHYPYRLYAQVTPVFIKAEETAVSQLKSAGISADDIRYIIVSHFHGDHITALNDFPKARFICMRHGYERIKDLRGIQATRQGFLPQLVPPDFESRVDFIDWDLSQYRIAPILPFEYTFDFFGDGSLLFIPLDGHFPGQTGLLIQGEDGRNCFLVADACWLSKNYREMVLPHPLAMTIMNSPRQYRTDLQHIHDFAKAQPQVQIIPSHCTEAFEAFQNTASDSSNTDF